MKKDRYFAFVQGFLLIPFKPTISHEILMFLQLIAVASVNAKFGSSLHQNGNGEWEAGLPFDLFWQNSIVLAFVI